ncbi:MAG: hypothetical protein ACPHY8_05230 [Patescibacteria group bacterium]
MYLFNFSFQCKNSSSTINSIELISQPSFSINSHEAKAVQPVANKSSITATLFQGFIAFLWISNELEPYSKS